MNEWTFTADIAKWMEQVIADHPDLPFLRVEVEERQVGSLKRRDLTLYGQNGTPVLTGEMKMPDKRDGRNPFNTSLVFDAHLKANSIGVEYFFTWNVNHCVLWKTFEQGKPIVDRWIDHFRVLPAPIQHSDEVSHPRVQEQIRTFLLNLLRQCAAIMSGKQPTTLMPLDEKFLILWEAALEQPVAQTLQSMSDLYDFDKAFTRSLDCWMREEQGWPISHKDDAIIRDNLSNAARLSCYVLAGKLIFYKALRKRYKALSELRIATDIQTGAEVLEYLRQTFESAKRQTRDYETVFADGFGDSLPFLSQDSVSSWRDLIDDTDGFDFTKIDYELIGQIFERMLSTEERHKFGQHYTRSEVVDLINSFCIRHASDVVLDPACGGGTFLVRAYKRKQDLSHGELQHNDLLKQIFGLDISAYPAYLSTINLATRDLVDSANYPRIAHRDFFHTDAHDAIFHIPLGSEGGQTVMEDIPEADAVVGNPPYVRHEKISEYYGGSYKNLLQRTALRDAPNSNLSGRSDIHCYFFTHALSYLKPGGYVGFLISSTWLDTTYGFRLQEFLLNNFEIISVLESSCEPWFTGARVTTSIVILRFQPDQTKRNNNNVRFVSLNAEIASILTYSKEPDDSRMTFDELRDQIETRAGTEELAIYPGNGGPVIVRQDSFNHMRLRIVNQGELYRLGCSNRPDLLNESESKETSTIGGNFNSPTNTSSYFGYKWGIFLRAPDVFFKLLMKGRDCFVPLGTIANVRRGVTSGCDKFFFVKDITQQELDRHNSEVEFKAKFGISKSDTERVRIVLSGEETKHIIEAEYLRPVVFNLMEIDTVAVIPEDLKKSAVVIGLSKDLLAGTHAVKYINWGELQDFHLGSSCKGRDPWYSLSLAEGGDMLWSMTQRYRYIVASNERRIPCNKRLFSITCKNGEHSATLQAILNSTVVALARYCFGRIQGGDPVSETEVVDVKMMLVPGPQFANSEMEEWLSQEWEDFSQRHVGKLVDVDGPDKGLSGELAMRDRQELDDIVLQLLGISSASERRAICAELYSEVSRLYHAIRAAELRMQKMRSQSSRRGRPTARTIAEEIWEGMTVAPLFRTPLDFAGEYPSETVNLPQGKARVLESSLFETAGVLIAQKFVSLGDSRRAHFAAALSDLGISGPVQIPISGDACEISLYQFNEERRLLNDEFAQLSAEHTSDDKMREGIVAELWRKVRAPYVLIQ